MAAAEAEFESFVRTIAEVEKVYVLADGDRKLELQQRFRSINSIEFVDIPTNDSWIRDYGPIFILDTDGNQLVGVDWNYDGWGQKYPPFEFDQQVAQQVLRFLGLPRVQSRMITEGGALETDGQSFCMATRKSLTQRNRSIDESDLVKEISTWTGMEHVILLENELIAGDDTDGHVDQVARFVDSQRAVVSAQQWQCVRPTLQQNGIDPIELPDPAPTKMHGRELPCRYTNFYIANGIVVVPQFHDPQDSNAVAVLREQFPDHEVIPLPSIELAVGLGSFHCLSQQQPGLRPRLN